MGDNTLPAHLERWWTQRQPLPNGLLVGLDGSLVDRGRISPRYTRVSGGLRDPGSVKDHRSESEVDRGRLAYSPELRRLAGVTQVVSPNLETASMHSRGSHSYKVATIAREIAEHVARRAIIDPAVADVVLSFGGLDITACETAGLAHDLGHPPFGHVGEHILDERLRTNAVGDWDGFEGNAQTLRIVTVLARRRRNAPLDLTNVTLAAIAKYPWVRDTEVTTSAAGHPLPHGKPHVKFSAYSTERDALQQARTAVMPNDDDVDYGATKARPQQSLEASIMDLADDIAYSIHDLEDFCVSGTIKIERVREELSRARLQLEGAEDPNGDSNVFVDAVVKLQRDYKQFDQNSFVAAISEVYGLFDRMSTNSGGTWSPGDFELIVRQQLSHKVDRFFGAIRCDNEVGMPPVYLGEAPWHEMQVMKLITKRFLVSSPAVGRLQRAQTAALNSLFDNLVAWVREATDLRTLPPSLQDALQVNAAVLPEGEPLTLGHYRAIRDYLCGLSDAQAFSISQWLSGIALPGASLNDLPSA